jgi:hypothetical protein
MTSQAVGLNPLNPSIVAIEIRQLEYAAWLLFYEAMHGIDFFGPDQDPEGTTAAGFGFISHLARLNPGKGDNVVENLAKLGVKVQLTTDGKTSDIKTTRHYREALADQNPIAVTKTTYVTLTLNGQTITFEKKTTYILSPAELP